MLHLSYIELKKFEKLYFINKNLNVFTNVLKNNNILKKSFEVKYFSKKKKSEYFSLNKGP